MGPRDFPRSRRPTYFPVSFTSTALLASWESPVVLVPRVPRLPLPTPTPHDTRRPLRLAPNPEGERYESEGRSESRLMWQPLIIRERRGKGPVGLPSPSPGIPHPHRHLTQDRVSTVCRVCLRNRPHPDRAFPRVPNNPNPDAGFRPPGTLFPPGPTSPWDSDLHGLGLRPGPLIPTDDVGTTQTFHPLRTGTLPRPPKSDSGPPPLPPGTPPSVSGLSWTLGVRTLDNRQSISPTADPPSEWTEQGGRSGSTRATRTEDGSTLHRS